MPRTYVRATQCARCGESKDDPTKFTVVGSYADGTPRLSAWCRECINWRRRQPDARQAANRRKRARRVERAGDRLVTSPTGRLVKAKCTKGHPRTPENVRPGKFDCATCHREREVERQRADGSVPRGAPGSSWTCGHDPAVHMRYSKGAPKDCAECHRARERARPYDPERYRRYAQKNRERITAYGKAWRAVNRPLAKEARKGSAEDLEYARIIAKDPCVYCGGPAGSVDHILALSRGGPTDWSNFAPACRSCNSTKYTCDLLPFLLSRLPPSRDNPVATGITLSSEDRGDATPGSAEVRATRS